jgi:kinesin family member 1
MPVRMYGRNVGLFSEGTLFIATCISTNLVELSRPYLHTYTHSNELEEVGVISLDGVNVDSDPQKELLLGVRNYCLFFT